MANVFFRINHRPALAESIPFRFLKGLLFFALLTSCSPEQPLKIGDTPPVFTPADLSGRRVNIPGDYKGKVVMIRFWAESCPACTEEMPLLEEIYRQKKAEGFEVVAVNATQDKAAVAAFRDRHGLTYTLCLDSYSMMSKRYGVVALPTTIILDRQGVIRKKILGASNLGSALDP